MIKFWFEFFLIFFILGLLILVILPLFFKSINMEKNIILGVIFYLFLAGSVSSILVQFTTIETFLSDNQYDVDAILVDKNYSTKKIETSDSVSSRAVKYYYNTLLDDAYTLIYFNGSNQEYKFKDYEIIKK